MAGSEVQFDHGSAMDGPRVPVDESIRLLSNSRRRSIFRYLMSRPDETVTVSDLVDHVTATESPVANQPPDSERVRIDVQCVQLPYLVDAGLVDYEPDSGHLDYAGDDQLELLLRRIDEIYSDGR